MSPIAKSSPFFQAISAMNVWHNAKLSSLKPQDVGSYSEVIRRLERMAKQYDRLLAINEALIDNYCPQSQFDEDTNISLTDYKELGITTQMTLNRADPTVPIKVDSSSSIGAYHAGVKYPNESEDNALLKFELEELIETYYYSSHRVLHLVKKLPEMRNFKCKDISIVRNHLIEHANYGDPYTFGFGTSGPLVKPTGIGIRMWTDNGLIPNTCSFVDALKLAFSKA